MPAYSNIKKDKTITRCKEDTWIKNYIPITEIMYLFQLEAYETTLLLKKMKKIHPIAVIKSERVSYVNVLFFPEEYYRKIFPIIN